MATSSPWLNTFVRSLRPTSYPSIFTRHVSTTSPMMAKAPKKTTDKDKVTAAKAKSKLQRKKNPKYKCYDLREAEKFSLCDAMRYIRAFEVGRSPSIPKYECHVKIKTRRDGAVMRNQLKLPNSVKTGAAICVICPPGSPAAQQAREAGAMLVGEEDIFEVIKSGKIGFDRCIAHPDSIPKMAKAGIPKILGPRGLMPNFKLGTIVENPGGAVRSMLGGSLYRERRGVVRLAIGQVGFTPEQLRDNIRVFLDKLKKDAANLSEVITKEITEVVLSSTNSPGFSLNGEFKSQDSPPTRLMSGS